jgi:hypothetical protein
MTRDEFIAAARAEGYAEPVAVSRDGSYRLDDHAHPFDAFAWITEGAITLDVAGQVTTYAAGSTFRLPAGTFHVEWAGPQGVQYLAARRELPRH